MWHSSETTRLCSQPWHSSGQSIYHEAHISKVVSTGFSYLHRLRQLRNILDWDLCQRLVSARWYYRGSTTVTQCLALFAGLPASTLKPLQTLINAVVRYVENLGPYDGVTNTLKELHWLLIKRHITYKLCVMMHSADSGVVPSYIKNMLTSVADMRGRLRSAASGSFDVPRVRTRIGSQAFSVAGPQAWNSLPVEMRSAPMTRSVFKNRLKTFLFEQAYPAIGQWGCSYQNFDLI